MLYDNSNELAHIAALHAQLEAVRRERDEAASDRDDWITSWRALQRHNERIEAALRRAKAEGVEQMSELRKAMELYREASYQGHSAHWDKTGGSGTGCPACIRATELRAQARQIVDAIDARAAQIEEGK